MHKVKYFWVATKVFSQQHTSFFVWNLLHEIVLCPVLNKKHFKKVIKRFGYFHSIKDQCSWRRPNPWPLVYRQCSTTEPQERREFIVWLVCNGFVGDSYWIVRRSKWHTCKQKETFEDQNLKESSFPWDDISRSSLQGVRGTDEQACRDLYSELHLEGGAWRLQCLSVADFDKLVENRSPTFARHSKSRRILVRRKDRVCLGTAIKLEYDLGSFSPWIPGSRWWNEVEQSLAQKSYPDFSWTVSSC